MKFFIGLIIVTASMIGGYIGFGGHLEVFCFNFKLFVSRD